jgi:YfiH family protein
MLDAGLPVRAFFTDREGGVSDAPYDSLNLAEHVGDAPAAVAANRKVLAELAGAPVTFMDPQHGAVVAHIAKPGDTAPPADILVTLTPGVALVTIAADCVPVLVHDPVSGAVAAAHIGRMGLHNGAVDNLVAAVADTRGAWGEVRTITAVIGPAICGKCYEVPEAMRTLVAERHPAAFSTTKWGTPALDLPRAIESRMAHLGITVVRHAQCTFEDPNLFSHRMDGVTGRQSGVIVCEGPGVSLP